jgi:hypothetical protein
LIGFVGISLGALLKFKPKNSISITFCIDSTIYFGNNNGLLDSFTISRSNLIDTGEPAYFLKETDPIISTDAILLFSLFGLLVLSILLFIINIKQRKKINTEVQGHSNEKIADMVIMPIEITQEKAKSNPLFRSGKIVELLDQQEISFLKYLYNHSADERMTTIEEINRELGTFSKTLEIQKKMRSDMISRINSKLATFSKSAKPVIDKHRSEFDRRSYEYFILPEHMKLVEDIIKANID